MAKRNVGRDHPTMAKTRAEWSKAVFRWMADWVPSQMMSGDAKRFSSRVMGNA